MIYKLIDIASVIRTKNSGPFELTFDILIKDNDIYERITKACIINSKLISELYNIDENDVIGVINFPYARAIKVTIIRPIASGSLGERDVYGAQQHFPLMDFKFELKE